MIGENLEIRFALIHICFLLEILCHSWLIKLLPGGRGEGREGARTSQRKAWVEGRDQQDLEDREGAGHVVVDVDAEEDN